MHARSPCSHIVFFVLLFGAAVAQLPPRLNNHSIRIQVGTLGNVPLSNFIIEGTAAKPVVIRVVGPGLVPFGLAGALVDPILTVHNGSGAVVATNDDWGGIAALKAAFTAIGAFALNDTSKDAALLVTLNPGIYTLVAVGSGGTTGIVLVELYETDNTSRFVYLTVRAQVGTGNAAVINGFVLGGSSNSSMLVRALGPSLSSYGVPGALTDPTLRLFRSNGTQVDANDNWSGTAISDGAFTAGLIPLIPGSNDSALSVSLSPGIYQAQIAGVNNTTGIGVLEVAQIDANRAASFAPGLLVPPAPASVTPGASTTLSAIAIGKPTPTYQWRKDGVNIPGATSAGLALNNFQPADAGNFSVVLANSAGTTTSANYVVSLNALATPAIVTPPSAQAVALGGTATFTVVVSGNPSPSYQWLFNGAVITGATSAVLTRTNVQSATLGTYSVRVTNSLGTVASAGAALTIAVPPVITTQPAGASVPSGNSFSFTVIAVGSAPLTYQWRKDGVNIAGANNSIFSIPTATTANSGNYTCVVTNNGGSVTSNAALLTVTRNYAGFYFGTFEGNRGSWSLVVRNDNVGTFMAFLNNPRSGIIVTVQVAADGTFSVPSALIQEATPLRSLGGHSVAAAGQAFTLTGTIGTNTVTGSLQGLNVSFSGTLDAPNGSTAAVSGIYQSPGAGGVGTTYVVLGTAGRAAALTVGATLVDGGLGTIGTNGAFTITTPDNTKVTGNVTPTSGSLTGTVTPPSGTAVAITGSITTGLGMPTITIPPAAQSVVTNAPVTLSVTAGGKTPLTYQWKKDGSDIPGATSATFSIAAAQVADTGNYTCVISNAEGVVTSDPSALTVAGTTRIVNLSILTEIASAGDNFSLGYVVGGNGVSGPKPLVIRAAGPSLGALGVPGTLDDPRMELFAGAAKTGENDNWGGSSQLATALADVGAFGYTGPTSRDAALLANITTSNNSVVVSGVGTGTGRVIAEVYDATPNDLYTLLTPRLVNVSVLKEIGAGFTVGFVIGGSGSKTVLIRAVGPGLAAVGVTSGTLADPRLTLFAGTAQTNENDNWGGAPALAATMAQNGAFAIPAASRDAALLTTLQPGQYSARVDGPAGADGLVLVEVYEVP